MSAAILLLRRKVCELGGAEERTFIRKQDHLFLFNSGLHFCSDLLNHCICCLKYKAGELWVESYQATIHDLMQNNHPWFIFIKLGFFCQSWVTCNLSSSSILAASRSRLICSLETIEWVKTQPTKIPSLFGLSQKSLCPPLGNSCIFFLIHLKFSNFEASLLKEFIHC